VTRDDEGRALESSSARPLRSLDDYTLHYDYAKAPGNCRGAHYSTKSRVTLSRAQS